MNLRRSIGWGALGGGTVAGAMALALLLGHNHATSVDEQGRALVAEGQYLSAIRMLSGVVARAPGDARAHYYLGLAYAGIGMCGAASIHYEEAARLEPEYERLHASPGPACRGAISIATPWPFRSRGPE